MSPSPNSSPALPAPAVEPWPSSLCESADELVRLYERSLYAERQRLEAMLEHLPSSLMKPSLVHLLVEQGGRTAYQALGRNPELEPTFARALVEPELARIREGVARRAFSVLEVAFQRILPLRHLPGVLREEESAEWVRLAEEPPSPPGPARPDERAHLLLALRLLGGWEVEPEREQALLGAIQGRVGALPSLFLVLPHGDERAELSLLLSRERLSEELLLGLFQWLRDQDSLLAFARSPRALEQPEVWAHLLEADKVPVLEEVCGHAPAARARDAFLRLLAVAPGRAAEVLSRLPAGSLQRADLATLLASPEADLRLRAIAASSRVVAEEAQSLVQVRRPR